LAKKELTVEQKKADIDLWIIIIISLVALGIYLFLQEQIVSVVNDKNVHILLRVLATAAFQFALAGLGIVVVAIFRKENFFSYGLRAQGTILSICLSALCFVPHIVFMALTGGIDSYLPFQSVWTTEELLSSGFPFNVMGLIITTAAWGFFEGFNYVVVREKLSKRYPSKNKWLDWGAIVCAVLCIVIHGAIGVTVEGIMEMLTIMIGIYGMLMVKKFTGNAWGCVFIFVFIWNAF
jgi:hypothetical protein